MTLININDTLAAVENVLSPILQQANVTADSAAATAATLHQADVSALADLRAEVVRLQDIIDSQDPDDPPPPPPPPTPDFIVGSSTGPSALDTEEEGEREYYNNTTVANMLRDAEDQLKAGDIPFMSMKPYGRTTTNNWAQIGAGQGDSAWVKPALDGLEALAVKYNKPVYFAVHHEPDDEILGGWKASDFVAMQMHIATLAVSRPHVKYGVITMGYHQWEKTDVPMSSVVPPQLAALLDYVAFDPYDEKANKDWTSYISKIKNWIAQSGNPKLEFGVTETGTTAATFASHPDWFSKTVSAWKNGGAKFWIYWNSIVSGSGATDWRMNAAMVKAFNDLPDNT